MSFYNSQTKPENSIVTVTAATVTLSKDLHYGKLVLLDRAAGIAVTLPDATGSGLEFELIVKTTVTTPSTTIKVANATDTMIGFAIQAADAGATANTYEAAGTDDTITLNGTTTGGIAGDYIRLIDIGGDKWWVHMTQSATGTEATPFSATV